ncbi:MAG: DMT family transporter [Lachnospiraceae bacterium]|nr:DMT family transporter [Lachnospiraceae bacterium]
MEKKEHFLEKTYIMIFVAMICCLLWGSAFPCIKTGYRLFNISGDDAKSQILFAGIRFAIAGFMVIITHSIRSKGIVLPKEPKKILVLSLFQTILQYYFFYVGMAHTTGVKSSIITGAGTFITLFISALLFKQESLTTRKIAGSLVGFIGLILVNVNGKSIDFDLCFNGEGFILIAGLSAAMSSGFIKKFSKDTDVVMLSGYQFMFGGTVMAVIGFIMGGRLGAVSTEGMVLLLYMGFISACAYTLWSLLLKHNDVSKVSACKFMNPVFGVLLSAIILNEGSTLGSYVIVSLLLICLGIFIVNYKK